MKTRWMIMAGLVGLCGMAQAAFVTIGHAGNAADTTGYGAVGYTYQISATEVTIAEFTASGAGNGNENYWNTSSRTVGTTAPAVNVSLYEAMKYCNWLTSGNILLGAYQFSGGVYQSTDRASAVTTYGTVYALPTEDEWYKAAYYKPVNDGSYSLYANGTDTIPTWGTTYGWNYLGGGDGTNYVNENPNYTWTVGYGGVEQNGTYNMMGNVYEWIENSDGVMRGGSYWFDELALRSSTLGASSPGNESWEIGFRIVAISGSAMADGDDFNDNTVNTNKWGNYEWLTPGCTNVFLTETNAHLEFTGSPTNNANWIIIRPWIASVESYTQNWEASVDINLGAVSLPPNCDILLGLSVVKDGDATHNNFNINLNLGSGSWGRVYEWDAAANGIELTNHTSTTDTNSRLRIAFDASTKILTASYNGNVLGSLDVDDAGTSWNMTSSSTFGVALAGEMSGNYTYSGDEVYADNFTVTGAVAPSEDSDGNGLPDWWEQQYFGSTGVNPSAICSNGVNTIAQAYVAGLNPTNSSARFGITQNPRNVMQWNAVSGRVYNVYWATNLMNTFQPLQTNYTGGAITDSLHSAAGKCFYKIDVRLGE